MLPRSLPRPDIFLPRPGVPVLRWGIIGAGWIAERFVEAVRSHTEQTIVAVATRSIASAESFGDRLGIPRAFGEVEHMLSSGEVDAVYIAAPADQHLRLGLASIDAGVHVLIEKPLATSADEARALTEAGRRRGVLVMEAMWTRYLPQTQVLRELLGDGALGDVVSVITDHGQVAAADSRLRRGGPGSGVLLDLGIYSAQLGSLALGPVHSVSAVGRVNDAGADEAATVALAHEGGGMTTFTTTIDTFTPTVASVNGSLARVEFAGPFNMPFGFTLREAGWAGESLTYVDETGVRLFDALAWQAMAFAEYAAAGLVESPLHTHAETVAILAVLDAARAQVRRRA